VPETVTFAGIVIDPVADGFKGAPIQDAMVRMLRFSDNSLIMETTTGTDGSFSLAIPTGGAAVDGYLELTKSGLESTYIYPGRPMVSDRITTIDDPITMMDIAGLDLIYTFAGAPPRSPDQGTVLIEVDDCSGTPMEGVIASFEPAVGNVGYSVGPRMPSIKGTETYTDGAVFGFNAPVGSLTISSHYRNNDLATIKAGSHAGGLILTYIRP
jgi:hypothetical protein